MDRQSLSLRFLSLANAVEVFSPEVAAAIRSAVAGEGGQHTWLVRWSEVKREYAGLPERIVAYAWVIARTCGGGLVRLVPRYGYYQAHSVSRVEPLNEVDVEDARRARELGLVEVSVKPQFLPPKAGTITTEEEFEGVLRVARPIWVDDSPRGHVILGEEPGEDHEGRATTFPILGEDIERGPGFAVECVPQPWIGAYSKLTAYDEGGATRIEAHFCNGGGGPMVADPPEDAEWRIPRHLVEQILALVKEGDLLREQENLFRREQDVMAERSRLERKFGIK